MKRKTFIPYLDLCRHYFNAVESLTLVDPKSDDFSVTIYQKELVFVAQCLADYSKALHDSIISACVECNLENVIVSSSVK